MRTLWPLLFGLLVSCSGADEENHILDLTGRTFVSQSVAPRALLPGTEIRVKFDSGYRVVATAGCNTLSGSYRFDGEKLVVAALMPSTALACDAAHVDQDNWLATFLWARPMADFSDPSLTLANEVGTMAMLDREIASPDRPLVGTQWIGSGIKDNVGTTVPVMSPNLAVAFAPDGSFQAYSGCQRANGTVIARNAVLSFTALAYDGGICPDSDFQPQSASFLFVLNGMQATFMIEERELTISRAGMTLYFTSAQ